MMTAHEVAIAAAFERQQNTIKELCRALAQFIAGADAGFVSVEVDRAARDALKRARAA